MLRLNKYNPLLSNGTLNRIQLSNSILLFIRAYCLFLNGLINKQID